MLSFKPQYHPQIESGEFAGHWAAISMPVGSSATWAALCQAEAARIQKDGGVVIYFNPKAGPEDEELVAQLQKLLSQQVQ